MDANFDAKEWVNSAFRNHKDSGVSKDVSNFLRNTLKHINRKKEINSLHTCRIMKV